MWTLQITIGLTLLEQLTHSLVMVYTTVMIKSLTFDQIMATILKIILLIPVSIYLYYGLCFIY